MRILKLIKLNWYSISQFKYILFAFPLVGIITSVMDTELGFWGLPIFALLGNIIFQPYFFSSDEKDGLDNLYLSLPTNSTEIIKARYFAAVALNLVLYLTFYTTIWIVAPLKIPYDTIMMLYQLMLISHGICFIVMSIQYPVIVKFGYVKSQMAQFIPFGLILSIMFILSRSGLDAVVSNINMSVIAVFVFLVGVVLFWGSYFLSLKTRKNKLR